MKLEWKKRKITTEEKDAFTQNMKSEEMNITTIARHKVCFCLPEYCVNGDLIKNEDASSNGSSARDAVDDDFDPINSAWFVGTGESSGL